MIHSALPWEGNVTFEFILPAPKAFTLLLRMPAWAGSYSLSLNGDKFDPQSQLSPGIMAETACGYNPTRATHLVIERTWQAGDRVQMNLEMPIKQYRQDSRVRGCEGKFAIGRGPLVYCLESVDHPDGNIFKIPVDITSLQPVFDQELLGGVVKLVGKQQDGTSLSLIPYMSWGNRGVAGMTVFFLG